MYGSVWSATRRREAAAFVEDDERYEEQWREALPAKPGRRGRGPASEPYDPDAAEEEALTRRRGRPRRSAVPQPDMNRPMDAVDVAAAPSPHSTAPCCTGCRPRRWSPTSRRA